MKRAERQQVAAVLRDVEAWVRFANEARHMSSHYPIAGAEALSDDAAALVAVMGQAEAAGDLATAAPLAKTAFFDGRKKLVPAHEALARLTQFHTDIRSGAHDEALLKVHTAALERTRAEAARLQEAYASLYATSQTIEQVDLDVAHMPLSRRGALTAAEENAIRSLKKALRHHAAPAWRMVSGEGCSSGDCAEAHRSSRIVVELYDEITAGGVGAEIDAAAQRLAKQRVAESESIHTLFREVVRWPERTKAIRKSRDEALSLATGRIDPMEKAGTETRIGGIPVRVMPVVAEDGIAVSALALLRDAPLSKADEAQLKQIDTVAGTFLANAKIALGADWLCHRDNRCASLHDALAQVHQEAGGVESTLSALTASPGKPFPDLDAMTDPTLGLTSLLSGGKNALELVPANTVANAGAGIHRIIDAAAAAKKSATDAKKAGDLVRGLDVAKAMKAMDLEALRKASVDSIRTAALEAAGLRNVWDVFKFREKRRLDELPGLGETTARSITQATLRLFEGVRDETPVRIDVKARGKATTDLLEALRTWDAARRFNPSDDELAAAKATSALMRGKVPPTRILAAAQVPSGRSAPSVTQLLDDALARSASSTMTGDVWTDFLSRPADYFGMLNELGFITEDEQKMHGDLPDEIVEAVRALELKRDYLTASLRTYQSFGARFCLVQKKVVIGDEMGLGKTVEALAVFTHLRALGQHHFIVVCPAAVVSNWVREAAKHTTLRTSRIHGPMAERTYAAKAWQRTGGVAVTTYDLLPWLLGHLDDVDIACAVFDEAHYIKNPQAKRSVAAANLIDSVEHAVLMTGTPLENRVEEFRNLINYLRPDLANHAPEYLPSKFRKHMAPAYLRRNQEDVLTELPELIEIDEWMGMSEADSRAYRTAVEDGQFMMMRRAAMLSERSLKVERLVEIVAEAEANERRVIVFSYFREVLAEVARVLPGQVFGPLTGSMPAAERQKLVDRFSAAKAGAVLVAQVTAGGVGLNIQSASVVVICEPQIKPTMEAQAIARAHRMGQTNTVQVHRLLTESSVDERIREILAEKKRLFDEFARDSVIAQQAPDAVDMSDAELARVVIAAERERLFGSSSA